MADGRILIADDEPTFLKTTADLFRQEGYECETAEDAEQAWLRLREGGFDVLVADIKMPGNSDLALVDRIQQEQLDIPVILVTGYPSVKSAVHSVNLDVAAYVTKPVEFEELRAAVERALRGRQARRAILDNAKRLSDWSRDALASQQEGGSVDVEAFFALTTRNILQSLTDLRNITRAVQGRTTQEACQLLNCPRPLELTRALADAIAVLHKTKASFKSKELGALRKRLELVVNQYGLQLGDYERRDEQEAPRAS